MPRGVYPRRVKHHAVQPLDKPYRFIPLTQGQITTVDAEDFEWLSQWNWHALWSPCTRSFYAVRTVKSKTLLMHRVILACGPGKEGDHRNHDTLDNRRENIRKCTSSQNRQNQNIRRDNASGFRGVSWNKRDGKWYVQIKAKRVISIGRFNDIKEAARAYDEAAKKYFGEFAKLNFPLETLQ